MSLLFMEFTWLEYLKLTMNKVTFISSGVTPKTDSPCIHPLVVSLPSRLYTSVSTNRILSSSAMRAAGGNLFSFICCVVGIYASGMQPGSGTSVVRTEMNRAALAAGYFTNMWPENTPRAQPPSIRRFRFAASAFPFASAIFDFEDFYIFRSYSIQFDDFIMVDVKEIYIDNAL